MDRTILTVMDELGLPYFDEEAALPYTEDFGGGYSFAPEPIPLPVQFYNEQLLSEAIDSLIAKAEKSRDMNRVAFEKLKESKRTEEGPTQDTIEIGKVPRRKITTTVPMGYSLSGKLVPYGRYSQGYIDSFGKFHPGLPPGVGGLGDFGSVPFGAQQSKDALIARMFSGKYPNEDYELLY